MKGISLRKVPNAPVAGAVAEMSEGERAVVAVREDFALRRAEAQDFVGLVALQERRVAALEGFRAEAASRPEDGWVAEWRGQDGVLRREMERAELSPAAREEARREHERFMAFSSVEIGREANRRWVERGRETMGASADRLFQAGEVEEGLATLHRGRAAGFFSEAEVEERTARAESDQRTRLADGFLAEDPFGMEAEMEEARGTGRSELFPWMGEVEIAQRAEQARTAVRERRRAVSERVDRAIAEGSVLDERGMRMLAEEGRFPEEDLADFAIGLRVKNPQTEQEWAKVLRTRTKLTTALEGYSAEIDPEEEIYRTLRLSIRSLPRQERGAWLDRLEVRRREEGDYQALTRARVYEWIDGVLDRPSASRETRESDVWRGGQWTKERFARQLENDPWMKRQRTEDWLHEEMGREVTLRMVQALRRDDER